MKLDFMLVIDEINRHVTGIRTLVDMLAAHGVEMDNAVKDVGILQPEDLILPDDEVIGNVFVPAGDVEVPERLDPEMLLRMVKGSPILLTAHDPGKAKPLSAHVVSVREVSDELAVKVERAEGAVPKAKRKRGKRNLSPEARKRISAAQKKRWDEHRANKASASVQ